MISEEADRDRQRNSVSRRPSLKYAQPPVVVPALPVPVVRMQDCRAVFRQP